MRAIAIVNQKGGCGKTTTAINLSAFLAAERRRVLLVDIDPQGHSTLGLQRQVAEPDRTAADVLLQHVTLREAAFRVRPDLDLVTADIRLAAVPEALAGVPGREDRLAEALEHARHAYDYVIVDCPPNVGLLTFNALRACGEAIIPMDPSFFSLHGIAKVLETIDLVAGRTGHEIAARALVTLYTGRSAFVRAVVEELRKHLGGETYETVIRFSVKLAEAASHGVPIVDYAPRCAGFEDYQALAREVLAREPAAMATSAAGASANGAVAAAQNGAVEAADEAAQNGAVEPAHNGADEAAQNGAVAATQNGGDEAAQNGAARPAPIDRGSPPIRSGDGVIFSVEAPWARCVQLAGDFNGWQVSGGEMEHDGPVWWKVVPLSPGRYHYRYVVDGHWQSDPANSEAEVSPYGDFNSVVTVPDHDRD